jgi:hypothetical protein
MFDFDRGGFAMGFWDPFGDRLILMIVQIGGLYNLIKSKFKF